MLTSSVLHRLLPPGGLRPGSTVSVTGSTALLLALLAEASAAGAHLAAVGMPALSRLARSDLAALEAGIAPE